MTNPPAEDKDLAVKPRKTLGERDPNVVLGAHSITKLQGLSGKDSSSSLVPCLHTAMPLISRLSTPLCAFRQPRRKLGDISNRSGGSDVAQKPTVVLVAPKPLAKAIYQYPVNNYEQMDVRPFIDYTVCILFFCTGN